MRDGYNKKKNSLKIISTDDTIVEAHIAEMRMKSKRHQILQAYESDERIWQGSTNKCWYVKLDGKTVKKKNRVDLEDAIVHYELKREEEQNNPTLEELFYEWIDDRLNRKRIAKGTYDRQVNEYKKHFCETSFGHKRIGEVNSDIDWIKFIESEVARLELTSKGLSRFKEIVKGTLLHAKRQSLIDFNVTDMLAMADIRPFVKPKEDSKQVFTSDELYSLINYLISNLDGKNLAILLVISTGLRPGEIVSLKWEDMDFTEYSIHIRRTETTYSSSDGRVLTVKDSPKTVAGRRNVLLPEENAWILDEIKKLKKYDDGYIFRMDKGDRLTAECLTKRFRSVQRNVNIPVRSLNKLRKTYGSLLLDNNADNRFVTMQMGHTSIETTERSYHRDRRSVDEKRRFLGAIPDLIIPKPNCAV